MPQIEADAGPTDSRTNRTKKMGEKGGGGGVPNDSLPLDTLKAEQRGNLWSLGH